MPLELRKDVHWCNCRGRAVFLDVRDDLYFCLPRTANDAFLRLAAGNPLNGDSDPLQPLMSRGILTPAGAGAAIAPPPSVEAAERDLAREQAHFPGLLPCLKLFLTEAWIARRIRTASFHSVLNSLSPARMRARPRNPYPSLSAIARASDTVAVLNSAHNRCLVRALAVHSTAARQGIQTKLVFGVIAHPFAAHCWVQFEQLVIVGGLEEVRNYCPILVVE